MTRDARDRGTSAGRFAVLVSVGASSASNTLLGFGIVRTATPNEAASLTTYLAIFLGGLGLARAIAQFSMLREGTPRSANNGRFASGRLDLAKSYAWVYLFVYLLAFGVALLVGGLTDFAITRLVVVLFVACAFAFAQDCVRICRLAISTAVRVAQMDVTWFLVMLVPFGLGDSHGAASFLLVWLIGALLSLILGVRGLGKWLNLSGSWRLLRPRLRTAVGGAMPAAVAFGLSPLTSVTISAFYSDAVLVGWRATAIVVFPLTLIASAVPGLILNHISSESEIRREGTPRLMGMAWFLGGVVGAFSALVMALFLLLPDEVYQQVFGSAGVDIPAYLPPTLGIAGLNAVLGFWASLLVLRGNAWAASIAPSMQGLLAFSALLILAALGTTFVSAAWGSLVGAAIGFLCGLRLATHMRARVLDRLGEV